MIRVGIIGTGGISEAHVDAYLAFPDRCRVVALADSIPGRAAEKAAKFGLDAIAYDDVDRMLREGDLDLVSIATPPSSHASLAAAASRAGVISLVEKPTGLSLSELDALLAVEAQTGTPILTVFQHRFGPAARHLRALTASGELGRPVVATCETMWFRDDEYFAAPWRGKWEVEGGGPTMGHGIHQFDLLLSILGGWREVTAFADRRLRPTETEDVSLALVRFESEALATVVNSVISPRETSRLRFDFEYATVEVEHLYGYESGDWKLTAAPGHEHLAEAWRHPQAEGEKSGHRDQIDAVLDAIENGDTPGVSLAEARSTLELAAGIYASAFRRRVISVGEISGEDPFTLTMSGGIAPWSLVEEVSA